MAARLRHNLNMFKTEVIAMNASFSKQRDYFYGAVGLLAVAALASVCAGSGFGFVAISVLIGLLCTRAQWARILTLVVSAYVGAVGALVTLFARGSVSFASFLAAFISAGVFW